MGNGHEGGNGNGWDRGFFRMMRYVVVIGGAVLYFARWEYKTTALQSSVDTLAVRIAHVAANSVSKIDMERFLVGGDREHKRIWRAIGRAEDAEELPR